MFRVIIMFKRSVFISLAFLIVGCTTDITTMNFAKNYSPERISGNFLPLKQKNTAAVGEVMFTAGEYSKEASRVKQEIFIINEFQTINVKHKLKTFTFYIKPGEYILFNKTNDGSYFKSNTFIETAHGTPTTIGGLFIPTNSLEATKFFWNWQLQQLNRPIVYTKNLSTPIKGIKDTKIQSLNNGYNSKSPTATVTYAGVSRGQIRFTYNEFTNSGYIKPSFTQDVYLDYRPNETYSYKSAVFKVYKADTSHISFEIIKPLN